MCIRDSTSAVEKSAIYRGRFVGETFVPLFRRHVLRFAGDFKFYNAPVIYENEVFRFGGLGSQRGFNEDELSSTTMVVMTAEYRFLLDRNSHLFLFYDQSLYENASGSYYQDYPLGFGTGFSFSTNFGVFSISYALGKQFDNPVLLSNGKIHFGYIAYF